MRVAVMIIFLVQQSFAEAKFVEHGVMRVDLPTLLRESDVVSLHVVLTRETRHLMAAKEFALMKPTAVFINTSRGPCVQEGALVEALLQGQIGGAALDVFEEEPLPEDHPLWELPNVVVSPHMAGDLHGWEEAVVAVFLDNLARFAQGSPLRNVVDKERGHGA